MLQARQLSSQIKYPATNTLPARKFLAFTLGLQEFCIDLAKVRDILDYEMIEPIPTLPDYVSGQIVLRGETMPAIDLRKLLNLGSPTCDAYTTIVVVCIGGRYAGLVVDCILDEIEISSRHIKKIYPSSRSNSDFMIACIKQGSRSLTIIDAEKLLPGQESSRQKEANYYH